MLYKNQELFDTIEAISDKLPDNLKVKDKKDLRIKLVEGIEDTKKGNICSIDDAFNEIMESIEMK